MVSHCDEQSLHNGPVFGCPWEDMASIAKTATVAAALRTAALDEAIAVHWMLESNRLLTPIKDGNKQVSAHMVQSVMLFIGLPMHYVRKRYRRRGLTLIGDAVYLRLQIWVYDVKS